MKRDKYDKVVSDLIRECYDYTCVKCLRNFRHNTGGLDCSHYYGRRAASVRYDMYNVLAHCKGCHRFFEENPCEFTQHYMEVFNQEVLDALRNRWAKTKKWLPPSKKTGYKGEKEEMYKHYQSELKRVKSLRMEGKQGFIKPVNWEI